MTVDELLHQLGDREGSGYDFSAGGRLIYGGKQLEKHRMLSDYGIQKECTIHFVLRLLGGKA